MTELATYKLDYGLASLVLTLSNDRFTSKAPMQNVDIPVSALKHFCVVPVPNDYSGSYNAQLVISFDEGGRQRTKKIQVRTTDSTFVAFVTALGTRRPDASLLHLDPAAAQKQMGVLSTAKLGWIIGLAILGAVLAAVAIAAVLQ